MAQYCGLQITNSQSPIADYVANDGRTYEVVNITTIKVPDITFTAFNQPHLYGSIHDEKKPLGHIDSDLKANYLTREQLQARKIAPSIQPDQVLDAKPN